MLLYLLSDDAQAIATQTGYAPLSQTAIQTAKQALNGMVFNGAPLP